MVVAPAYPSMGSIAGIFVADQVAALQPICDITVVAPQARGWRHVIGQPGGGAGLERPTGDVTVLRPIARTWIPRSPRSVAEGFIQAVSEAFREMSERGLPDLIHAHVINPAGYAAVVVGRRFGVPVVVTEHSGPFEAILRSGFERRAAAWTIDHADSVLAVGPRLRDELLRLVPGGRIDVVENVVDTAYFRPIEQPITRVEGPLRLFTLGIQAPQKGTDVLLRAVATLIGQGLGTELVIGGDGPERPGLEAEARRLGILSSTRFVGLLSRSEVRDWLQWCDVFVSASRHESFGLAIAEAIACERPVVATRSGGPESFMDAASGILVELENADAIADAITRIVTRQVTLDGPGARRRLEDSLAPSVFRSKIMRVYESLLGEAATARPA